MPVVGHFSCSYFELNHIENCFFSLPAPSMNAVFSYELHLKVSYSSEVSSKCFFLWSYFFHILTSKVSRILSRICFLWVSSNISSLVLDFATVSGSARRNFAVYSPVSFFALFPAFNSIGWQFLMSVWISDMPQLPVLY